MTMISDEFGNVRILLHPPEIAVLTPDADFLYVVHNNTNQYGIPLQGLKRICFDTSQPRQVQLSPHRERLSNIFSDLGLQKGVFVDIGAYDGVNHSHTRALVEKGWQGLMLEYEPFRFATLAELYRLFPQITLTRCKVTPHNVLSLLEAAEIPTQFDFLSLDIDSYDYFVLEQILSKHRPTVICTEINEVIPPPIRFAVKYNPHFELDLSQRFYGMSLAAVADLAKRHGYALMHMYYMDLFLIDLNFLEGEEEDLPGFYRQHFLDLPRPSYYHNYPFDTEAVFKAEPEAALALIQAGYAAFEGQFLCSLSPF
jgi:hypothetical protein